MIRKIKRYEQRTRSTESILQSRVGQLVCRDCSKPCKADVAIKESRGRKRCPDCGGWLDRSKS